jgi:hypothetical protein
LPRAWIAAMSTAPKWVRPLMARAAGAAALATVAGLLHHFLRQRSGNFNVGRDGD